MRKPLPPPTPRPEDDAAPRLRLSTAISASDPTVIGQAIARAFTVDKRRARRLAEDLEWAIHLLYSPTWRKQPSRRQIRKQTRALASRNRVDPVQRVL